MSIIYRKTAKGVAEIETRAHRLAPRLRSALIIVDGKRSDAALAALIQQDPTETLHALAGQGFIEVLSIAAAPATPATPAAAVASAPVAAAPLRPQTPPQPTPATGAAPDLQARRREAVRAVNDLLGPAGEATALRVERARSVDELRVALSAAVQTVGAARGRQAAEAFAARFSDV